MEQVKLPEFPRDGRYDYTQSINCPRVMNCNGAVDGCDLMPFINGVSINRENRSPLEKKSPIAREIAFPTVVTKFAFVENYRVSLCLIVHVHYLSAMFLFIYISHYNEIFNC